MRRFETNSTLAIALTILTIAGLLPLYIGLDRTPLPWADEVEFASTAISVRNGNPAIPSVLSGFPQTGRFDLFYGPVGIRLGATWMTLFGVNMWSWRSLSFAGGILVIVFSALLAYSLGARSPVPAAAACLVAFTIALGGRINSGRLDTITVALELMALTLLVVSLTSRGWRRCLVSVLAGGCVAAAALSTPRALPFCVGLFVGALVLLFRRKDLLGAFLPAVVLAVSAFQIWIHSQGWGILTWVRFMANTVHGNEGDISPVMGGSWGAREAFFLPELAAPLLFAVVLGCVLCLLMLRRHQDGRVITVSLELLFVLIAGFVNMLLSFVLLSRALNYEIFFIVPVLVGLLVVSERLIFVNRSLPVRLIVVAWLLFGLFGTTVRAAKILDLYWRWSDRDPRPIVAFIREHVPPDSIVLGLDPCYFWAIQDSGSLYLFTAEVTSPGLASGLSFEAQRLFSTEAANKRRVYVVWKRGSRPPILVSGSTLVRVGGFEGRARQGVFSNLSSRVVAAYPQTDLYQLEIPE